MLINSLEAEEVNEKRRKRRKGERPQNGKRDQTCWKEEGKKKKRRVASSSFFLSLSLSPNPVKKRRKREREKREKTRFCLIWKLFRSFPLQCFPSYRTTRQQLPREWEGERRTPKQSKRKCSFSFLSLPFFTRVLKGCVHSVAVWEEGERRREERRCFGVLHSKGEDWEARNPSFLFAFFVCAPLGLQCWHYLAMGKEGEGGGGLKIAL